MAQLYKLDKPSVPELIGQFADRFARDSAQQQSSELERQRLAIMQQQANDAAEQGRGQLDVQRGQLDVSRGTLDLAKSKTEQDRRDAYFANFIKTAIDPYMDGTPEGMATAKKNLEALIASDPSAQKDLAAYAMRLANQPTMADRTKADVGRFAETQAHTAATGGTDPNAVNFATHSAIGAFMPPEGFQQQQAADLQARGGGTTSPIPKPTGNAVTDFERRATSAMPTSAQDLTANTQITTTGMQEAGSMARAKLMAAAKTAAPSAATVQPGTREYGIAQDLSSGKLTFDQFQKLFGRGNNPMKAAIYSTATQINPNFDPSTFELGYKFAQNKGIRQQVASADNALKMIPEAIDISDKATRLGPTAINKLIMSGGVMLGGKKYTDAQTLQKAFGDEISGALGFGSATDMTRELGLSMADLNFSSPNFRSAMQIVETFLKNKRGSLVNQMGPYGNTVDQFSGGNPGKGNPLGLTPPK